MAEISPRRHRMIGDMTVRNFSPVMQRSCIHAVSRFSRHFGRLPDGLGLEDVPAFQVQLVSTEISGPSHNQNVCALLVFYGVTVRQDTISERIPYAREPRTLPVVLSADEVVPFLEAVSRLKSRAALTIVYVAGASISEVIGIKVGDIDCQRVAKAGAVHPSAILKKSCRVSEAAPAPLRAFRTRAARVHIAHARLAGESEISPALSCRPEQRRIAP